MMLVLIADGNLTAFSGANVITGQGSSAPTGTPDTSTTGTVNNVYLLQDIQLLK